ncbi:MAG TPA: metallophosphoesterase [Chloroflexota bacterium]|nr:metallophosphoesterase [Chloroflexota bacterium]
MSLAQELAHNAAFGRLIETRPGITKRALHPLVCDLIMQCSLTTVGDAMKMYRDSQESQGPPAGFGSTSLYQSPCSAPRPSNILENPVENPSHMGGADAEEEEEVEREEVVREAQRKGREKRLKGEVKALRARESWRQDLIDAVREEFRRTPDLEVSAPLAQRSGGHKPRSLVLHLSDIHVGQLFSRAKSGGLGGYDLSVFEKRAHALTQKVTALTQDIRRSGPVDRLVLLFNGDLVDGRDIHPGHDIQSEGMGPQMRVGPEVMAQAVVAPLARLFPQVDVFATPGNHGRLGKKGQLDRVEDSMDLVFMDILKLRCQSASNITWHPWDKSYAWFTLHGHTYFVAHGDAFKSWMNLPTYGATNYKGRLESLINRKIDVLLCGHHHNPAHWATGFTNIVLNGSWVGTGEFGAFLGMGGPPVQKMILVTEDFACSTSYDLILEKREKCLTGAPVEL